MRAVRGWVDGVMSWGYGEMVMVDSWRVDVCRVCKLLTFEHIYIRILIHVQTMLLFKFQNIHTYI